MSYVRFFNTRFSGALSLGGTDQNVKTYSNQKVTLQVFQKNNCFFTKGFAKQRESVSEWDHKRTRK